MTGQISRVKNQNYSPNVKTGNSEYCNTEDMYHDVKMVTRTARNGTDIKRRAYRFAVDVIEFVNSSANQSVRDSIRDQLMRAAASVGANLVEARSASSRRDFVKYYEIALKSSNESKYWLCLVRDAFNIDGRSIQNLLDEISELSNIIAASIITMKKRR